MRIILVTLSDNRCHKGQEKVHKSALELGKIDDSIQWSWAQFKKTTYYQDNKQLFDERRGLGFWGWKPFVILDAFESINDNDIILYHDAGRPCYDWHIDYDVRPFVDYIIRNHNGLGVVFGPWNHGKMTKRDCFIHMKCDIPRYHNHKQLSATWSIWQKNKFCTNILQEWKNWICSPTRIVTDDKSKNTEHTFYNTHRHDQSILTNILLNYVFSKKYSVLHARGYEKNINNMLKCHLPPSQQHIINEPISVKMKNNDGYIFYDVFINHENKVVGIGPFYPHLINYNKITISYKNKKSIQPRIINDPHKHTNIMIFDIKCSDQERISISYDNVIVKTETLRKVVYSPKNIVASTMFKNCSSFLETWLRYHIYIGVEHFYLFNNNSSDDDIMNVQKICNKFNGYTTIINWNFPYKSPVNRHSPSAQTTQQNLTIYKYNKHNWILLTDLDEYIYSKTSSLLEVVKSKEHIKNDISGLTIPCMWFGCSHNAQYTDDYLHKLIFRKSTANTCRPGGGPKSLVRPTNSQVYSVHRSIVGKKEHPLNPDVLRFNHYFSLTNDNTRYKLIASAARRKGNHCDCSKFDTVLDNSLSNFYKTIPTTICPLSSPTKKFIFISIPKNASQSIHKMFNIRLKDTSNIADIGIFDNHCRSVILKHRYSDYNERFKFCFVRNPWERLISWFENHKNHFKLPLYKKHTFESWVIAGFPHHWGLQNGTRYRREKRSPLDQWEFIFDDNNNQMVDFIGHMETFYDDLHHIFKQIDYTFPQIEHKNKSNQEKNWRSYYNEHTFNLVKQRFHRDIHTFGYQNTTFP
uniref:Glycosyltransferase family 92 protein n=1 Tax=viral metagenome TaxID=1070528 RepID=A0A6C0F6B1_9ZZZZ|tara:strand:+ start:4201 stop:6618 length:2418 start_codon:yes stop_codon:yes gene_type:complete